MINRSFCVLALVTLLALGGCEKSPSRNSEKSVGDKAVSNYRAELENRIAARASLENFKAARPPVDLTGSVPTNKEIFQLSYCVQVEMTRWYNEAEGAFSAVQLGQASDFAVKTCDRYIDAVTRTNMNLAQQMASSPEIASNPKTSKHADFLSSHAPY